MFHPQSPHNMPRMTEMPDEVLLLIQSYLPLTSLILARGVCKLWHSLIPGSHIPDYRRRLLELYLRAVSSPAFHATRKSISVQQYPLNRKKFIAELPCDIPEDFRCWVQEWPERAVIGSIWPALRHARHAHSDRSLLSDRGTSILGVHILAHLSFQGPAPGTIHAIMPTKKAEGDCGRALLLNDSFVQGWQTSQVLLLNGTFEGVDISGKVYTMTGTKCGLDMPAAENWTDFLLQELEREEAWLRDRERIC